MLRARDEVLRADMEQYSSGKISAEKIPLDAGFIELPERLLDEYREDRKNSELGQILSTAHRVKEQVDSVVVLGIGGSYMGARALMQCCREPYFNELSRSERGGRPRMYFAGNNVDNDELHGLLHLLRNQSTCARAAGSDHRWALVVISKSGGTLETAVAFRLFLNELYQAVGDDQLGEFVIPVTGSTGRLADLASAISCRNRFLVPEGVGGRFSIFSAVGLLPAAILGIDVVALLEGAVTMNEHFASAPPGANAVLDYVAVNHLSETHCQCHTRVLSIWSNSLESIGLWYDQLLAESLGKEGRGALPLTVVNTRDLHSRAQQHQEGRRDKIINNLIVDSWRCDPLQVGSSPWDQDQLNELADRTLPEIMTAAIQGTNFAYRDDGRLTTDLHLPEVNEVYIGQLLQMLMLATVVEGRLIGINPYGQPGVEKYKKYMNQFLREPVPN
jgi:glucose-6-phosphate isomerase